MLLSALFSMTKQDFGQINVENKLMFSQLQKGRQIKNFERDLYTGFKVILQLV